MLPVAVTKSFLTAMQLMYFRSYGWRHVFAQWSEMARIKDDTYFSSSSPGDGTGGEVCCLWLRLVCQSGSSFCLEWVLASTCLFWYWCRGMGQIWHWRTNLKGTSPSLVPGVIYYFKIRRWICHVGEFVWPEAWLRAGGRRTGRHFVTDFEIFGPSHNRTVACLLDEERMGCGK